jgi:hypothetical protein
LGLLGVAWLGVDRPQVVQLVWSVFGQGDHVVDLVGTWLSTDMTHAVELAHHQSVAALFSAA